MCGICGVVCSSSDVPVDRDALDRMTRILSHRGPDDGGVFVAPGAGLGHRRLSIIGLGDGNQPMASEDGGVTVVYNGELYSHPEQRRRLEADGYCYRTSSDTETFLHLYKQSKLDFLKDANGMFALALWDNPRRRLILARDRAGIKPLYYYAAPWGLVFASELKSLLQYPNVPRELDLDALNHYLTFLYVPAPRSILKGIRKLLPGQMLVYENGSIKEITFWNPRDFLTSPEVRTIDAPREAVAQVRNGLETAVRSHLLADVQVGAFLSGGIDSSAIVALMAKELGSGFPTFSIGFEGVDLFDETAQARDFAKRIGTEHFERRLNPKDLLRTLPNISWQVDEPMADSSCIPVYEVSKLAQQNVKVVLSGDGGDELFAGYRKYLGEYFYRKFQWIPNPVLKGIASLGQNLLPESRANRFFDLLRQAKKFLRGLDPEAYQRHYQWACYFDQSKREELFHPGRLSEFDIHAPEATMSACFHSCPSDISLEKMLWTEMFFGLPDDMLTKVDRMSMFHSLEVRVPFLDRQLVETALRIPGNLKLRGKESKWVLREAFRDILPAEIFSRPKHGFDVPIGEWFRGPLRPQMEAAIEPKRVESRGIFRPSALRRLYDTHLSRRRDFSNQLWQILTLECWQQMYLDRQPSLTAPGEQEWL